MTFTKRQFFIYRIKQCINFHSKILGYMTDVSSYVNGTKYSKEVNKIEKGIEKSLTKLNKFIDKVDKKTVD